LQRLNGKDCRAVAGSQMRGCVLGGASSVGDKVEIKTGSGQ
jgi:hypothetical protein